MTERHVQMDVRLRIALWPGDAPRGAVSAFCAQQGISRSWFYELRSRAREDGGMAAVMPRSRAPKTSPQQISPVVAELAVQTRRRLRDTGCYDGPWSVLAAWPADAPPAPSQATLSRLFMARGLVVPTPRKRPRSSQHRYQREQPNDLWCSDGFDWQLGDGTQVCVLQLLDDCSRRDLGSQAASGETSEEIQAMLAAAIEANGLPQQFLTDNGSGFNPHRRGHRGQVAAWLNDQGVDTITCSVNHPQGNGKSERSHQTMQKWLAARPRAATLADLQTQLDGFREYYNHRPHQGLGGASPQQVWDELHHAPAPRPGDAPERILARTIKVAANGNVAVHPIATVQIGNRHAGIKVHVLIDNHGDTVSIFDSIGTEIRTVTIEPGRTYYGLRPRR